MKKYLLSTIALSALLLTSCEKESEGLTRTTYYPVLNVVGGSVVMSIGDSYTEQGCTAILNGVDVTDKIKTTNNIDNTKPGVYSVNYLIVNEDGFAASASRNVYVTNGKNFDNLYLSECQYGSRHYYDLPINIVDNGDGTYLIDDILGGFYALGRYPGYPYDFYAEAVIQVNPDNSISLVSVGSWYFSQYEISIVTGVYDPATCTITLNLDFDGDPVYVQLVVPGNN